jgi:hypothetical protein
MTHGEEDKIIVAVEVNKLGFIPREASAAVSR